MKDSIISKNLKNTKPVVKTMLSIGGWNMGTEEMTKMLVTQGNRVEFVASILAASIIFVSSNSMVWTWTLNTQELDAHLLRTISTSPFSARNC